MGMVFQNFNLFPHKSVLENITLAPVKVKKEDPKTAAEDACRMEHTMSTESFTAIKNFIIQNQA